MTRDPDKIKERILLIQERINSRVNQLEKGQLEDEATFDEEARILAMELRDLALEIIRYDDYKKKLN